MTVTVWYFWGHNPGLLKTLNSQQVDAFFKLMDERYSRKSTVIASNLDFPQWYDLFQRKPLVDALLDRLNHHCITIRISGPSLRLPIRTEPQETGDHSYRKQTSKSKSPKKWSHTGRVKQSEQNRVSF